MSERFDEIVQLKTSDFTCAVTNQDTINAIAESIVLSRTNDGFDNIEDFWRDVFDDDDKHRTRYR